MVLDLEGLPIEACKATLEDEAFLSTHVSGGNMKNLNFPELFFFPERYVLSNPCIVFILKNTKSNNLPIWQLIINTLSQRC